MVDLGRYQDLMALSVPGQGFGDDRLTLIDVCRVK
jgi:hypothetical protein